MTPEIQAYVSRPEVSFLLQRVKLQIIDESMKSTTFILPLFKKYLRNITVIKGCFYIFANEVGHIEGQGRTAHFGV